MRRLDLVRRYFVAWRPRILLHKILTSYSHPTQTNMAKKKRGPTSPTSPDETGSPEKVAAASAGAALLSTTTLPRGAKDSQHQSSDSQHQSSGGDAINNNNAAKRTKKDDKTITNTNTTALPAFISARDSICPNILSAIGDTPLVKLNSIPEQMAGLTSRGVEVLCKCEWFNAGGSVKDRIGRRMVEDAEREGRIKPGDTLIEPTSGNTGIGIALASAIKGYRCIITMPEKMSKEKVDVLKALGAEIVRTPTEAAFDSPESHISVARRLNAEIPNSHILDQYANPSNPLAHYQGTAEEIWRQCGGKVDMLVAGAGTGGTISGIAKKLKEYNPNIQVVGVDPVGSVLALPDSLNDESRLAPYQTEGIGYDFVPDVLDRSLVDYWMKSNDKNSLVMMRRLIKQEGLLCGGSCGAAVSCALEAAKSLKMGQRCVVILPDSVRNYMTKSLSDEWMIDHGFVDNHVIRKPTYSTWWSMNRVCDIKMNTPLTITSEVTCKDAIALLKEEGFDMVPVLDNGNVIGVVTEGNMTSKILSGRAKPDQSVADAGVMYKTFHKFSMNDSLADLAHALDHEPYALVVTEQRCFSGKRKAAGDRKDSDASADHVVTRCVVSGIVTRIDLLEYISEGESKHQNSSKEST